MTDTKDDSVYRINPSSTYKVSNLTMSNRNVKGRNERKSSTGGTSTTDRYSNPDGIITAAEMIRQQKKHKLLPVRTSISNTTTTDISTNQSSITDVDDEIQRLERELQQDDDSNEIDSEDDASSTRSDEEDHHDIQTDVMILSISESNQNPIEKLPTQFLPPIPVTSKSKHSTKSEKNSKKRSRNDDTTNDTNENISGAGLKKAVQELIQNYQGRASTERIPYYCRYCQHQATNDKDFRHHQTIPSHLQNVTVHNKASYCKLCSKQFNSPIQLQEHLKSKPHHDRLQYLQSKQPHRPNRNKPTFRQPQQRPHSQNRYNKAETK